MWFITSIVLKTREQHTFGFYSKYNDAIEAIKNNTGNMEECLYDTLVLEYIEEGIHSLSHLAEWFVWSPRTPTQKKGWTPIEKCPDEFVGIINFALG